MARRNRRSVAQWLDDAERAESQVDYSLTGWSVLAMLGCIIVGAAVLNLVG